MCTVCGCGDGKASIEHAHDHHHDHGHGHGGNYHHHHHGHGHDHGHAHDHQHDHHHHHADDRASGDAGLLDCSANPAGQSIAGMSSDRIIQVERDILGKNDRLAADNRARFAADGVLAFNLVSSPGAGKTSLLVRAVSELKSSCPIGVIEGDQQTSNDAERIRATGVSAIQVNTGKGCHLDAAMVGEAYDRLPWLNGGLLFIENVGNLVCPAAFDLGEACKIVVFSTTEGEDKPLKYPHMFRAVKIVIVNKMDLAPHVGFDEAACCDNIRAVNPGAEIICLSAKTGQNLETWLDRLMQLRNAI